MKKSILTTLCAAFVISLMLIMTFSPAISAEECAVHSYENGICTVCGEYEPITPNGNIYEISNAGQLYWFAEYVNGVNNTVSGKLMTDINLNPGYTFNTNGTFTGGSSPREWTPIGNGSVAYEGDFIGNGKTVSGIYYNNSESDYIGLFGQIGSGGEIHGVGVINSYISGAGYVGGICGYNNSGIIDGCYNAGTVKGSYITGGVCGYNNYGTVRLSYNTGTVDGTESVGGVSGDNTSGSLLNNYNTGTVKGTTNVGGVCGYIMNNDATLENCFNTGSVSGTSDKGGVCGGSHYGNITNCYYLNTSISGGNSYGLSRTALQFNDGTVAFALNGGITQANPLVWYQKLTGENADLLPVLVSTGDNSVYLSVNYDANGFSLNQDSYTNTPTDTLTEVDKKYQPAKLKDGYYEISSPGQLFWFAAQVNDSNNLTYNGKLMRDIVINEGYVLGAGGTDGIVSGGSSPRTWIPIGKDYNYKYGGIFEGNNKTVSGIYINTNTIYNGLFGYVDAAGTVQNLTVENSYISCSRYAGGICGNNYGAITNCHNNGTVGGKSYVGGICGASGDSSAVIANCSNTGTIIGIIVETEADSGRYIGGICGSLSQGIIRDGQNTGTVSGNQRIGGVCGSQYQGTIENCYNNGTVSGNGNTGGVCGYNYSSTVSLSYNTANIICSGDYVGGVCGYNYEDDTAVTNCYNIGEIRGANCVGGVCGYNDNYTTVTNCYNIGDVVGTGYYVGGVCGQKSNSTVSNCYYLADCAKDGDSITQYGIGNGTQGSATADVAENTMGKTAAQFADGSVAYALNGGSTQVNPLVWYQTLTGANADEYPITDNTHGTVYCTYFDDNGFYTAGATEKSVCTNSSVALYMPAALSDGIYQIENSGNLYWFAAKVNGGETSICGNLATDINLNPGYTLTFVTDSGLVEVKNNGSIVCYLGTDIKGTTRFNETASEQGKFYSAEYTVTSAYEGLRMWSPIGNNANTYTGTFDGNGKTVSGMYINGSSSAGSGLFGSIGNDTSSGGSLGTVNDVNVASSYVRVFQIGGGVCGINYGIMSDCSNSGVVCGEYSVGGVCGVNSEIIVNCSNSGMVFGETQYIGGVCGVNSATISGCRNSGSVYSEYGAGGVCGENYNTNAIIKDSYNTGSVNSYARESSTDIQVGGVCGRNGSGTINNCFNAGAVSGIIEVGGVCGVNYSDSIIKNCYNTGTISGDVNFGSVCGYNYSGAITNCYYLAESETDSYDGTTYRTAAQFADGSVAYELNGKRSVGTEENPLSWYQMLTGNNADEYPMLDSTRGTVYIAYNDGNGIYTSNVTEDFMYFNSPDANYEPAELKNGCYEIANAGQLFWFAAKINGKIEPIEGKLTANIFLNPGYTFTFDPDTGLVIVKKDGGIVGYFGTGAEGDASGSNTDFDGETASARGAFYLLTESGYAASPDSVPDDLHIWTPIKAYSGFSFDGTGKKVNGIYFNDTSVNNVALFETITPHGIIKDVNVENSYINGGSDVSGVCARNSGKVTECSNSGIVIGQFSVGGVCGVSNGETVDNCYNSGTIIGFNSVGGVCGSNSGGLTGCRNDGRVIGGRQVGGILGISINSCSVRLCHNTGTVSGSNDVGGICGFGQGININICYNTGTVSGGSGVGGICGLLTLNGSMDNCYNAETVSGNGICGNIADDAITSNCYYLAESETDSYDGTTYKTAAQFADGSVAWLLNTAGKNVDEAGYAHSGKWSQGAEYPVFADATNKAVYKVGITGAATKAFYRKSGESFTMPETVHVMAYTEPITVTADTVYTADAAITGVTPTVTDSITFAYDVTVAKDLSPTLSVTFGSSTEILTATASGEGNYRNYTFIFSGILPQQMTKNIKATLISGDTEYAEKSEYSVRTYALNRLSTSTNEAEKKFLVNMLYYGAAAQSHLNQTENIATDGLEELLGATVINGYRTSDDAWNNPGQLPLLDSFKDVRESSTDEFIVWHSATLVFDTTITMRLRFTTADIGAINSHYFLIENNNSIYSSGAISVNEAKKDQAVNNTYYIDIGGFTPTDYNTKISVMLYRVEFESGTPERVILSDTAIYSVMSYIDSMKDNETMKTLVRALYDYGISGKAYAESIGP